MVFQKGHKGYWKGKKRLEHSKKMSGKNHPLFGKYHTKETKEKMKLRAKERFKDSREREKISLFLKERFKDPRNHPNFGKVGYWAGKKRPEISGEHNPMYGVSRYGKDNPNWLGGISFEPYTPEFNEQLKESIRERDNRICQLCDVPENGRKLDIHHINYNKKDCRPENLIALCNRCNLKVNYNRKYWINYFRELSKNMVNCYENLN